MNKNKVIGIIEGAIIVALGVLVAIFGGGAVVDIYFGVTSLVIGVAFLAVSIYQIAKTKSLDFANLALAGILIAIGSALFTPYLSFAMLINIIVIAILGFGAALVLYGVYLLANKYTLLGVTAIIIGAALVTLTALFIALPDFRGVFWIIVGIVIALYGVLYIVSVLIERKAIIKK